eukprot:971022-Amphidinium_carterae.1
MSSSARRQSLTMTNSTLTRTPVACSSCRPCGDKSKFNILGRALSVGLSARSLRLQFAAAGLRFVHTGSLV